MSKNTINILDVQVSNLSHKAIKQTIGGYLKSNQQHQVVTPNPEFLLTASHDDEFHYILNKADLAVPDGIGLKFAGWLKGYNIKRLAGSDLMHDILAQAQANNLKVAILNWSQSLSNPQDIKQALGKQYPQLKLYIQEIEKHKDNFNLDKLKTFQPAILFCTLGAPEQDKLIFKLLPQLPSVKLGLGIGGGFDFITNKVQRAPIIMRTIGLEWLWRLILNPTKRFKRIYQAVIVFTGAILKTTYINKFLYRPNVVGFIFNNQQKVLILNSNKIKPTENYWKMPQGGVNRGETKLMAIKREMREEIGSDNFKVLAQYNNIYKYKWGKNYGIMGYKGQKQTLFILEYLGQPDNIKLSLEHKAYKWVPIKNLLTEADKITQKAYQLFLKKYYETRKK